VEGEEREQGIKERERGGIAVVAGLFFKVDQSVNFRSEEWYSIFYLYCNCYQV